MRHAVIGITRELERGMPELVTTAWWKEERGEKVFVDSNQACRDRTLAPAYSPRPLPGAPVSTPATWAELHREPADLAPTSTLWDADVDRGLGELPFPPDHPKMPGEPRCVQPSRQRDDRGTQIVSCT